MILSCAVLFLALALPSPPSLGAADSQAPAIKEFKKRIEKYVELQKKVKAGLAPVEKTADASILVKQRKDLAAAMQQARKGATQGDILIPAARPVLRAIIRQQLSGPGGAKARSMILGEGNPKSKDTDEKGFEGKVVMKVNAVYPTNAPKSTVPPSVLQALPELPEQLEYRFIGRDLILRDTDADLIVDFIKHVVP